MNEIFHILRTSCIREAPDFLAINISLVPDKPVDQARPSGIPTLVQPSLDRCTDMHLGQAAQWGDGGQWGGRCEEDS